MRTQNQFLQDNEPSIIFKIIKGGLYYSKKKEKQINDFWAFCHATFWPTEIFTQSEEEQFKKLVAEHFSGTALVDKRFKELIQRATLAKRYIDRQPGRYVVRPVEWLNVNYQYGLSGTKGWYNKISEQRKTVPQHNEGLTLLAKAVLNYCRARNEINTHLYREELIRQKQFDLLAIYTNSIAHMHFFNL